MDARRIAPFGVGSTDVADGDLDPHGSYLEHYREVRDARDLLTPDAEEPREVADRGVLTIQIWLTRDGAAAHAATF